VSNLRRGVLLNNSLDLALIRRLVLLVQIERVGLGGRFRVRLIEQRLNTEENLFDVDRGFPAFFFIENGEADGARGVDVGVEKRGYEFAYSLLGERPGWGGWKEAHTLGWLRGVLV
jgi:hypothetical protein